MISTGTSPMARFEDAAAGNFWNAAETIARTQLNDANGDQGWAVCALARCALARGDCAEMHRWLDRADRLMNDDEDFHDFHISLLLQAGDVAAARQRLETKLTPDPSERLTIGTAMALILWLDNNTGQALDLMERLLSRHLVSVDGLLCSLADKFAAAAGRSGWVGHQGNGVLVGAWRDDGQASCGITVTGPDGKTAWCGSSDGFNKKFGKPVVSAGYRRFVLRLSSSQRHRTGSDGVGWAIDLDGERLLGSGLGLGQRRRIEGMVELDGRLVSGWAACPDDDKAPLPIFLVDERGKTTAVASTRRQDSHGQARQVFAVDIDGLAPGRVTATAGLPGEPLAGSPIRVPSKKVPAIAAKPADPIIDIVVPVYGSGEEALACLGRLFATTRRKAAEIVVVDDASPDAALAAALDRLAAGKKIILLRNPANLGFPGAVNRGMALHPRRDVVLLNADAVVSGDWLRRLRRAAYAKPECGTVTPLSNDASLCSYPSADEKARRRPIPDEKYVARLDRLARRVNAEDRVELPTAVGFCMYIRRDCLAETGLFSEDLFGRGYGEENDFCMRARHLGWRHFAATDVFVGHVGGTSFGKSRKLLQERNLRILERQHPGYQSLIDAFHAADPLAAARRRLDLARFPTADKKPTILLITLDLTGGVARHVEERGRQLTAEGWRVLFLAPAAARTPLDNSATLHRCRLSEPLRPDLRDLLFDSQAEFDGLVALLASLSVKAIEIHHSLNHHPVILDLPRRLRLPYDVVIHDYHWLCPQISLATADGRYCGEPDLAQCEQCRLAQGSEAGEAISVGDLRRRSARLLRRARRVVVPCQDVAQRYRRHFPFLSPEVIPWERIIAPIASANAHDTAAARKTRVCVVGAIGRHKGYQVLLACAADAAARDLPLEFSLVGYSSDDSALFATGRVFVTGRYREDEAVALIRQQAARIALVPSVCPETWCYTLSLAWQAGLQAVAFDLGAPAERIRDSNGGTLLPVGLEPAQINDQLIALSTNNYVPFKPLTPVGDLQEDSFMTPTNSAGQIMATPQEVPLPPGFFAITVTRGAGTGQPGQIPLPALQVTVPPPGDGRVEILSSHSGGWLTRQGDTVLLKVAQETVVLLTSYKNSQAAGDGLDIQISRVDSPTPQPVTLPPALSVPQASIVAHIQNLGDHTFSSKGWVGAVGQNLWIEGFGIVSENGLELDAIEYRAVTANGWETPWHTGSAFCGTRGQGVPLIGVGVRLHGQIAQRFDCLCEAAFVGGLRAVARNGAICRADVIGAPLEGFLLNFVQKS